LLQKSSKIINVDMVALVL